MNGVSISYVQHSMCILCSCAYRLDVMATSEYKLSTQDEKLFTGQRKWVVLSVLRPLGFRNKSSR